MKNRKPYMWIQHVFYSISVRLLFYILEETDIRSQMLNYFVILMQDTIELSLGTARRAHAANLQEMEKGKKLSYSMYANICETCSLYSRSGLYFLQQRYT